MPMQGYKISSYYRITVPELTIPWPCDPLPDRTCTLFSDDVLTRDEDGTYRKHTGVMIFNLNIPADKVEYVDKTVNLVGI